MAEEWKGLSNHQKAFKANKARASEAAASVTAEFVEGMTGAVVAEREASEEAAEGVEFDLAGAASKLLRSNRRKAKDDAASREERAERRSQEHAAAQEGAGRAQRAKPSGAAASLVDLSPTKFKTALTSLFKELDVDQAHWLKEIAESAENAAWKRVAANDPAPVERIKGRDEFDSDLAYDNYIEWKFPRGDDAGDDDDGDQDDE